MYQTFANGEGSGYNLDMQATQEAPKRIFLDATPDARRRVKSLAALASMTIPDYLDFLARYAAKHQIIPSGDKRDWPTGTREAKGAYDANG